MPCGFDELLSLTFESLKLNHKYTIHSMPLDLEKLANLSFLNYFSVFDVSNVFH